MRLGLMQTIGSRPMPLEYARFQLCREMGWTPDDLDRLPSHLFWLYYEFLLAEAEAGRMKALQSKHYAR